MHRYNQGKRHKALRESLRLIARKRSPRIHAFVVKTMKIPNISPEYRACHYFAQSSVWCNINRFLREFWREAEQD